jgi:hypothetical protein
MPGDLVTIATIPFLAEAEAARMHLISEGIPAFLADTEMLNAYWLWGNAIGYIKVQVPQSHADAAVAAIRRMRGQTDAAEGQPPEDVRCDRCPACGAAIAPGQRECTQCEWSYVADREPVQADQANGDLAEDSPAIEEHHSMDWLRSLKRPIFLVMLAPAFVMAVVVPLLFLKWLWEVLAR